MFDLEFVKVKMTSFNIYNIFVTDCIHKGSKGIWSTKQLATQLRTFKLKGFLTIVYPKPTRNKLDDKLNSTHEVW